MSLKDRIIDNISDEQDRNKLTDEYDITHVGEYISNCISHEFLSFRADYNAKEISELILDVSTHFGINRESDINLITNIITSSTPLLDEDVQEEIKQENTLRMIAQNSSTPEELFENLNYERSISKKTISEDNEFRLIDLYIENGKKFDDEINTSDIVERYFIARGEPKNLSNYMKDVARFLDSENLSLEEYCNIMHKYPEDKNFENVGKFCSSFCDYVGLGNEETIDFLNNALNYFYNVRETKHSDIGRAYGTYSALRNMDKDESREFREKIEKALEMDIEQKSDFRFTYAQSRKKYELSDDLDKKKESMSLSNESLSDDHDRSIDGNSSDTLSYLEADKTRLEDDVSVLSRYQSTDKDTEDGAEFSDDHTPLKKSNTRKSKQVNPDRIRDRSNISSSRSSNPMSKSKKAKKSIGRERNL